MFDTLDGYLSTVVSEYRASILIEAVESIAAVLGDYIHDDVLMIITNSNKDNNMKLAELDDLITTNLVLACKKFGVYINEDYQSDEYAPIMTDLLTALLTLDDYENPIRIQDICSDSFYPEDTLAELASEVTGRYDDDFLMIIRHVEPDLLARIETEAVYKIEKLDQSAEALEETDFKRKVVTRVKTSPYFKVDGWIETRIAGTGLFGEPAKVIFDAFKSDIFTLTTEQLPIVLYQLCCASDTPSRKVIDKANDLLQIIYGDDDFTKRRLVALQLRRMDIPMGWEFDETNTN